MTLWLVLESKVNTLKTSFLYN